MGNSIKLLAASPPTERGGLPAPLVSHSADATRFEREESPNETFLDYLDLVARNRAALAIFAVLGVAGGILAAWAQTPLFQARAAIEIEAGGGSSSWMDSASGRGGGDAALIEYDLMTQAEILRSHSLLAVVVDRLDLAARADVAAPNGRWHAWLAAFGMDWDNRSKIPPRERALGRAIESLEVRTSRRTRIVEIYSAWPDPELAASFSNALADAFIEGTLESRWEASRRAGAWLSTQLEEHRAELESSSERLQRYARDSGLMITSEQQNIAEEKLRQTQAELSRAQAARISSQARFEQRAAGDEEIAVDEAFAGHRAELAQLRLARAELAATLTPRHAKLRRVDARLSEVERAIEIERSRAVERLRADYSSAERRERLLRANYQRQLREVSDQANKSIEYRILNEEVESNRRLYESLLHKVKQAGVESAIQASRIRIVDPATAPRKAYRPRPLLNGLAGLCSGLLAGIAFVFISERADRTLRQPGEAVEFLTVPELGVIPISESAEPQLGALAAGEDGQAIEGAEEPPRLTAPVAAPESFRAALTSILFGSTLGRTPQVIMVTSPHPGEGKTTVSANLAMCLAEINQRVLLIDADLRKARMHRVFGLPRGRGLGDLLELSAALDADAIEPYLRRCSVPGLEVLSAGRPKRNIPNLLHSVRARELIEAARGRFDAIIIDTPPMIEIADARVLARWVDGSVMVLRAGKTTRAAAKEAVEQLHRDGSAVLGTLLNSWNPRHTGYGYYASYGYSGYYGREGDQEDDAA